MLAERMFVKSLKTCLPKSKNIYEKKDFFKLELFSRNNCFGHAQKSFKKIANFSWKSLSCPKAESKIKNEKTPSKNTYFHKTFADT